MKAYILHLFTMCGGGGRVSLEMAKALHERGVDVIYVTDSIERLKRCSKLLELPGDYKAIEAHSLLWDVLSMTRRFVRYRTSLLISKMYEKLKTVGIDGITIDTYTNVPLSVDVLYFHYPTVLMERTKKKSLPWRLYNKFVERKVQKVMGRPKLVMANSHWTAKLVKNIYNLDPVVLHPPVDVEYYMYDGRRKEKRILTVSRLVPEKKLHLLPQIASKLPDYEWYLVGSRGVGRMERGASTTVLHRLINAEVERSGGLRNFHVMVDVQRKELRELMLSASFYVHPPIAEHFGIAIAEAMAAGCIPIVYKDGGAWTDIVSPVSQDLGYSKIDEVISIIRRLENSPKQMKYLSQKSMERAKEFDAEHFRKNFIEYLEKLELM